MKIHMMTTLLGAAVFFSVASAFATTSEESRSQDAVYKCAQGADNMLGLATEYTFFLTSSSLKVTESKIAADGYQIEEGRTHNDEIPMVVKQGPVYEIKANFYSSEDSGFLREQNFKLDTRQLVLNYRATSNIEIQAPCRQVFPRPRISSAH